MAGGLLQLVTDANYHYKEPAEWTPKQHLGYQPEARREIFAWLMVVNRHPAANVGLRDVSHIVCKHLARGRYQLVSPSIYLTGNPAITFFKVVYRRQVNFVIEAIPIGVSKRQERKHQNKVYKKMDRRHLRQPKTKRRREKRQRASMKKGQFNSGR